MVISMTTTMKKFAALLVALVTIASFGISPSSAAPVLRIMPLGDSITWGSGNWDATGGGEGYRRFLQLRMQSAGFAFDMVGSQKSGTLDGDNEGHPGYTIDQIAAEGLGPNGWIAKAQPDLILLQIGTNDVMRGIPDAPRRLGQLLDSIHAENPDVTVFVATISRRKGPTTAYRYNDILTYNDGVESEVNRRIAAGFPLTLVNNEMVSGCLSDYYDYVHPDWTGYQKLAYNWYIAVRRQYGNSAWPLGQFPYTAYPCTSTTTTSVKKATVVKVTPRKS